MRSRRQLSSRPHELINAQRLFHEYMLACLAGRAARSARGCRGASAITDNVYVLGRNQRVGKSVVARAKPNWCECAALIRRRLAMPGASAHDSTNAREIRVRRRVIAGR